MLTSQSEKVNIMQSVNNRSFYTCALRAREAAAAAFDTNSELGREVARNTNFVDTDEFARAVAADAANRTGRLRLDEAVLGTYVFAQERGHAYATAYDENVYDERVCWAVLEMAAAECASDALAKYNALIAETDATVEYADAWATRLTEVWKPLVDLQGMRYEHTSATGRLRACIDITDARVDFALVEVRRPPLVPGGTPQVVWSASLPSCSVLDLVYAKSAACEPRHEYAGMLAVCDIMGRCEDIK